MKDELVDIKVSSEVTIGERDRLAGEVASSKKERDEARADILESKTDHNCKDKFIDHLAFLLEPHPGHLPADMVDEMHRMPEEIGVDVTPIDRRAPKPADTKFGMVALSIADPQISILHTYFSINFKLAFLLLT